MTKTHLISLILLMGLPLASRGQPTGGLSTRQMNLINWMEFQEVVPPRIETVLLPTGTLEPHGVIPNGADNVRSSRFIPRVASRSGF